MWPTKMMENESLFIESLLHMMVLELGISTDTDINPIPSFLLQNAVIGTVSLLRRCYRSSPDTNPEYRIEPSHVSTNVYWVF